VLDDELGRLPDHYWGVIVLCDLEGMTRKEAAGACLTPRIQPHTRQRQQEQDGPQVAGWLQQQEDWGTSVQLL
jgi:hypothetical protein